MSLTYNEACELATPFIQLADGSTGRIVEWHHSDEMLGVRRPDGVMRFIPAGRMTARDGPVSRNLARSTRVLVRFCRRRFR